MIGVYGPIPKGVRRVAPGVFDIMGHVGRRKLVSGIGAAAIAASLAFVSLDGTKIWTDLLEQFGYGVAWGGTHNEMRGYHLCVEGEGYPGCYPGISPWGYVWEVLFKYRWSRGHLTDTILMLVFMLTFPAIFLLRRRPVPIRVDGPRRMVYSWRKPRLFGLLGKGGLYVSGRRAVEIEQRDHLDEPELGAVINPLFVTLHHAEDPSRTARFAVGPMDAKGMPPSAIWSLAEQAMGNDDYARDLTERLPERFEIPFWQRLSLVPPRELPSDIDARAQVWHARAMAEGDESLQRMGEG